MTVCFIDTETTGLDPDRHEIWEVALIVNDREYLWQLPVDLGRAEARALDIGQFHERRWPDWPDVVAEDPDRLVIPAFSHGHVVDPSHLAEWCRYFASLTWGRHLVGAVVSFDEERLRRLLRRHGACPGWHYHLIDVEALAVGWLGATKPVYTAGDGTKLTWKHELPWDSKELSRAVGVDPGQFDQHTALGDARWAKAIYEAIVGGERKSGRLA